MRYLIFSDLHGNLEAFNAVISYFENKKIDQYIFLGDLVGYGASPNEVIQAAVKLKPSVMIRGNHDKAAYQKEPVENFNPIAASAIYWTQKQLKKKNLDFLKKLPQGPVIVGEEMTICHGAPYDEDYYIFGEFDAAEAFLHLKTKIGFFGHTHFPHVYIEKENFVESLPLKGSNPAFTIEKSVRYLINPGSVGQPRDRITKASCAVFDPEKGRIQIHRIKYNIKEAQKKIRAAGLPEALAQRLALGI